MSGGESEQLVLGLEHRPALGRGDFLVSGANATALAMLDDWRAWPGLRLALAGPPRAGKSHLAAVWRREAAAGLVPLPELADAAPDALATAPLAVEDVHALAGLSGPRRRASEEALFHLLNLMGAEGQPILLTGRDAPAAWGAAMPDLASRLAALPVARLGAPDDALLSALAVKLFADRQLAVSPRVMAHMLRRVERSVDAVERMVDALDRASLARRRAITTGMVNEILGAAAGPEC